MTVDVEGVPAARVLLLFDIDGTVLREEAGIGAHLAAVHAAVRSVYGVADPAAAGVQADSKTDLQIASEITGAAGCPPGLFRERAVRFCAAATREYAARCPPDLSGHVLPGIRELLASLAAHPGVRLGLLTGNIRGIAGLKLARARIAHPFAPPTGSFGCDADTRIRLPPLARSRAGAPGRPHARRLTRIIGDTPGDIACAHADRVPCVAVATGRYGTGDLAAADHVAASGGELAAILEWELSTWPGC